MTPGIARYNEKKEQLCKPSIGITFLNNGKTSYYKYSPALVWTASMLSG